MRNLDTRNTPSLACVSLTWLKGDRATSSGGCSPTASQVLRVCHVQQQRVKAMAMATATAARVVTRRSQKPMRDLEGRKFKSMRLFTHGEPEELGDAQLSEVRLDEVRGEVHGAAEV